MKEKKLYTCEICRTDFADKAQAIACEKSHIGIDKMKIVDIRIRPKQAWPDRITIRNTDGKEVIYKR